MRPIIVIVGPTGVGKTKLSIELAKKLNAEIINGDSVSIYKKLDIGSAKPTIEERENIPHHLIDIKEPNEEYSVYDYQQDVRKLIKDLSSKNKRIIIVGGTGLYIKAALYNYQFTKKNKNNTYDNLTNEELLEKISSYNYNHNIHINNRKRLVRMLNKLENNEVLTESKDECLYPIQVIGLTAKRDIVYQRINDRVEEMLKKGLLEEVTSLKPYYKTSRVLNTAIGYKEFTKYFTKEKELTTVIEDIKKNSRHYAKRQYTFFNHQFKTVWYETNFKDFNETINKVYNDIIKGA